MNTPTVLQGITKLLGCGRGTLSLMVLGCATAAVLLGKIDGMAYTAIIGTVHAMYTFTQHKVEIAQPPALPQK